jgi:predicted alpha-1,6-mannanase (GH76 family)
MDRLEWRRAIRLARLPGNVKVTLLTHADRGRGRWHDDQANLHAFSRERLAKATGHDERTIQRHLRLAEDAGWLKRHAGGYQGRQAEFHYMIPGDPEPCPECFQRETERETKSGPEGRQNPALKGNKIRP